MLVATPGQTTSYSTIHNNNSNGAGSNSTAAATSATKKSSIAGSTNNTNSSAAKSLNNNNNHSTSTVTTKNSLISNTHSTTCNYHPNSKNDIIVCNNKLGNQNKATATSSRDISSSKPVAPTHSLKNENSTNSTSTTIIKQQSFIQTLKDSVQKALISTTASSNSNNLIANNKLKNNCNNLTASINNVTSSSSTSHNANKVSTTTSSYTSSSSTAGAQPSSSGSGMRSKHLSCSLSKLYTVAPTVIHRFPEDRQGASSTDSLQKEMCHFKPIYLVPKSPWKGGNKSRCVRFPKANLATKKTEFVLKANCDVNNRKKKQQQNRKQNDKINVDEDVDDDNEQENKEFRGIYKPKPSLTCLSTSFTSPNHQSAFVCLVAKMKNLVNLQSKRQLIPVKSTGAFTNETSEESLNNLYVRKKKRSAKKQHTQEEMLELPRVRSTRLSLNVAKAIPVSNKSTLQADKEIEKRYNAKLNNISKKSSLAITKAKARRKSESAKTKTINKIALANTKVKEQLQKSISMPAVANNKIKTAARASVSTRKRKIANEDVKDLRCTLSLSPLTFKATSAKTLPPSSRKSSRLSTINIQQTTEKSSQKRYKKSTSAVCFSPPLTRSRLKWLAEQGKINTTDTIDIKNRKI